MQRLLRERVIPRLLAAPPERRADDEGRSTPSGDGIGFEAKSDLYSVMRRAGEAALAV